MGLEFSSLCRQLSQDISSGATQVDAVILTGQGDKAFSAGGNLDWLRSLKDNPVHVNADLMLRFYKSFLCIRELPVPVVAALQGPAIGAGAGLALACDLRVAARNKQRILGLNFTTLGIHTGMGAAHLMQNGATNCGNALLHELLLTGRTLSAEECLQYGLVNRLCDDSMEGAMDLVRDVVLQTNPVAVRTLLQTLRAPVETGFYQALHRDAFAQAVCYARDDWGEGVDAVAKKRNAVFDTYHAK